MGQIVKIAREVGTSAGVLLPRSWLNKEVVVTLKDLSEEEIARNVFEILLEKKLLAEVKGIYLIGSYARKDYDFNSDIDILAITRKKNKLVKLQDYEITLISEENFSKDIAGNLYKLLSVREAKTIFNDELIHKYKSVKPKLRIKEIKKEIKSILKINKEAITICEKTGKNVPDSIVYSLVLRARELYLMKCLLKDKLPNKKEFESLIDKQVYEAYLRVKRDEKVLNNVSAEQTLKIVGLIEKWLKE